MVRIGVAHGATALAFVAGSLAVPMPQQDGTVATYGSIDNDDIPGEPEPPVGAYGNVYPTNSVLGPQDFLATVATTTADAVATLSPDSYSLVPNQQAEASLGMILDFQDTENPQPIRGSNGATDPGPRNYYYDRINSDAVARPGTDMGDVPNFKWPMGLSSSRSGTGQNSGWARQQNTDELPIATAMAGVDMRLSPNAYRELHWHSANEWSYIFNGTVRVSAVNQDGQSYVDDLTAGDLWFFPAGVPHSIQAGSSGVEFLLVFDQGTFSEDDTDLVTELFLRNPREVLAKNFQTDISDFDDLPTDQLYIFDGTEFPTNLTEVRASITGPAGEVPYNQSYTYHFSEQNPLSVPGGSVKIADPTIFPIADNFSAALITIDPGAMREIHWHLTSDEWNFFLSGQARVTAFAGPQNSRTFDFAAGDVGYVPVADSHYVENTGSTPVTYLEILQAPKYQDISLGQWLGLTPQQVVSETLHLPPSLLDRLPKTKQYIVSGNANYSTTNFTVDSYPNTTLNAAKVNKRSTAAGREEAAAAAAMGTRMRTGRRRRDVEAGARTGSFGYTRNRHDE